MMLKCDVMGGVKQSGIDQTQMHIHHTSLGLYILQLISLINNGRTLVAAGNNL